MRDSVKETSDQMIKIWIQSWKSIKKEVPNLKKSLEEEFRNILRVEKN